MASDINVTESNSAPVTRNLTTYPVFAKKADLIRALQAGVGANEPALNDTIQRLSNTDTSTWTDKGSQAT